MDSPVDLIRQADEAVQSIGMLGQTESFLRAIGIPHDEFHDYLSEIGNLLAKHCTDAVPDRPLGDLVGVGLLHGFLVGWLAASNADATVTILRET